MEKIRIGNDSIEDEISKAEQDVLLLALGGAITKVRPSSMRSLGRASKTHFRTIENIEKGADLKVSTLFRIAKGLGVKISDLFAKAGY